MPVKIEQNITRLVGKLYHQVMGGTQVEEKKIEKNIVLYVGRLYGHMIDAIRDYEKQKKKKFRIGLIYDVKDKLDDYTKSALERIDLNLSCDTFSQEALQEMLMPYQHEVLAITSRPEDKIPLLIRVLPFVPYVNSPTIESLLWANDKIMTRERLSVYDKNLTPAFMVVDNTQKDGIKEIEETVGYPLIVKPSGMAASRLVNICFHREELEDALKKIFKKIDQTQKQEKENNLKVLVEHFMEGDMYSIDCYVNNEGKIFFCPMVSVKTGKTIGFDDFFGYTQITPTLLNDASIAAAQIVSEEAVYALGMRSTTVHIELMKTEQGWKVIEMGPRMGGFRHMMYEFSYGINHTMNDLLIRIPKKPEIPKKVKGYTVAMKFFAKKEGKLVGIAGVKKAQELKSFKRIYINKKNGEPCNFAKHGGSSVFNIIMFNEDRSELLADIRRLEQMIEIETD